MATLIEGTEICHIDFCDTAVKAEEVRSFREQSGGQCYVFICDRYAALEIFGAATVLAPTKKASERFEKSYVVVSPKTPPALKITNV
jgi:hypothetical protein